LRASVAKIAHYATEQQVCIAKRSFRRKSVEQAHKTNWQHFNTSEAPSKLCV